MPRGEGIMFTFTFLCSCFRRDFFVHKVLSNMNNFWADLFDPIDWTLEGTITQSKSWTGSNGNERVLHTPHKAPSDAD